jgi:predicted dehydrogenase
MSTLSAAVIGTGFIGPVHVEALQRAGVTVTGMLGSSAEKSRQTSERLGLTSGYASLDELVADDRVDVVHVTSPNRYHHQQVSAALKAGKHVVCEKPLAMTSAESAELVQLAKESGRAAAVNYNIRYYPLCTEASQRVLRGTLGRVFHVTGSYVQDWLFHATDFNWRVLKEDGGALRAIADIGTHWLDLLQFIMGEKVTSVCADLVTVHPERQRPIGGVEAYSGKISAVPASEVVKVATEDYGSVLLRFAGGSHGVMSVSQVAAGRKNCLRFELAGSHESISWNSESPNEMWIGHRDSPNELLLRDPALASDRAAALMNYPGGHNEGFADTFKQLFVDFYSSVAAGRLKDATFPTFDDGHHEILLCEAILNSHRQQRWINVNS